MRRAVFTYPLRLPLRAAHYDAIGRVIAFWAFVEREIKGEIAWLDQRVNEPKTIDFEKSFGALATKWGELAAKAALPRKAIIAINRIAGQSAKTKLRRDNLAHGTFLGSAEGPIYVKTKGGRIVALNEAPADLGEMRSLASEIGNIAADLLRLQAALGRLFDDRP